ncbi:MAG TPA: hypothetical protein VKA49_02425 [Flavitalea sp.]|nr:hypothetical protein [Flavitalea sp.]
MKPDDNTQEILLVMNNSFSRKQFAENDVLDGESSIQNTSEQLEQACWNGLLGSILPELIDLESKFFLWEIINHRSFLRLNFAVQPAVIDPAFSLNPEFFLNERQSN